MNINKLYSLFLKNPKICTDSRKVEKDSIFFALKGPKYNGNLFAEEALKKGAIIAVVDQCFKENDNRFFSVPNVLLCLQSLAKKHREKLHIPIIGITGTNGKTSTKEFIALLLSEKFNVAYTKGNLNNHIGVPLTILSINNNHTIAVLEFGANKKGDITEICEIAKPTHGLITNIGKAHLKDFINIENIINTKIELWEHLIKENGIIFFNYDDKILLQKSKELFNEKIKRTYKLYGINLAKKNNLQLITNSHLLIIDYDGALIQTNITGSYNFINIICAIKVALYFKVKAEIIKKLLPKIGVKNRSEFIKSKNNDIILDAYNANPNSMSIAIQDFLKIKNYKNEQKVLILGDMLELGKEEFIEHHKIIEILEKSNILEKNVFLIGCNFSKTKNQFQKFPTKEDFFCFLKNANIKNKLILIKGSRKIELENLIEEL